MTPDLVFAGGRVFCADAKRTFASAVAVADGAIVAVGNDEVRRLAGRATRVVGLDGGMLVPGFQDAHVHPVQGGLERMRCDLTEHHTEHDYADVVRRYADAHPEAEWITGGGWELSAFPGGTPTAAALDPVVADRPVFLPNRDHHGAWVNSAALQLAGIDRHTPDPSDGRIERDTAGRPTGTLHEGAMALVGRLVPPDTVEDMRAALLEAQRYLHSLGITAWQDAILGEYANLGDASDAYLSVLASGELTARVVGALWWERHRGAEQIPELVEKRRVLTRGRFRATSVKVMQDGVPENGTAAMTEPYLDPSGRRTTNTGISFVDPMALCEYVAALDAQAFQVHVHAIGDRAIRETLDAVSVARDRNGPSDNRHHLAHIQIVHPDDIGRFAALGVAANMQPLWAANEPQMVEMTIPVLGEERASWQYPFASLAASGAVLAAGSDWPVSSPDPIAGIHVAVNRRLPESELDGEYDAFLPHQALDVAAALTAYTAGSAYVNHLDDTGTIEVGKRADFAVLDRDPFTHPPDEIADSRVVATFVDGHQVF